MVGEAMTTHLTQAARLLAARTGDTLGDAEACILHVCDLCGCDPQEAAQHLTELLTKDTN